MANFLMASRYDDGRKSPRYYWDYYNRTFIYYRDTVDGKPEKFRSYSLGIPRIVVNAWASRIFSDDIQAFNITELAEEEGAGVEQVENLNTLERNSFTYNKKTTSLIEPFKKVLACGKVLMVMTSDKPKFFHDFEYIRDEEDRLIYAHWNDEEKIEKKGKIQTRTVRYVANYIADAPNITRNGQPVYTGIPGEDLALYVWETNSGLPIYESAIPLINDADDEWSEKTNDRTISKKGVLLPEQIAEVARQTSTGTTEINAADRIFRKIPVTEEASQAPYYYDGNYQPSPYIEGVKTNFTMISYHCGFGGNFLSFDQQTGAVTATQYKLDNLDARQTEEVLKETLTRAIHELYKYYYGYIVKVNYIDLTDEDTTAKQARLLQEVMAVGRSKESYYREMGYTEAEIQSIVNGGEITDIDPPEEERT